MSSSFYILKSLISQRSHLLLMISLMMMYACSNKDTQSISSQNFETTTIDIQQSIHKVIYGEDDRQDVYAVQNDHLRARAQKSIFAMIDASNVDESDPNNILLLGAPLRSSYRLCRGQRFRQQITASSCSTTLIDDQLLVTAGHCIESQASCEQKRFVLGYEMQNEDQLAQITSDQVFRCERLVLSVNNNSLDYAFVQLDRPVPNTIGEVAPVNSDPVALDQDEPLVMMGFPSGLPLKVDAGGKVSNPRANILDFFRATVDAFGGNSGSSVFNSLGEQVGILVRGETDYIPGGRRCNVVNELSDDRGVNDDAEEITYLFRALQDLCDSGYPSERLCGQAQSGLCFACEDHQDCIEGYLCGQFTDYPNGPSFCAPACNNADCPPGHECDSGQCKPILRNRCLNERQVAVYDSCNRFVAETENCDERSYCDTGVCLPIGEGNTCADATVIEAVSQVLRGDLSQGYTNTARPSCAGEGHDRYYRFTLEQAASFSATSQGFDTVLALYRSCGGEEIVCNDDSTPPGAYGSAIEANLEPGSYVLALDSYYLEQSSEYELNIDFCQDTCSVNSQRCTGNQVEVCVASSCGSIWEISDVCDGNSMCEVENQQASCVQQLPGDLCSNAISLDAVDQRLLIDFSNGYSADALTSCVRGPINDIFYRVQVNQDQRLRITASNLQLVSITTSCQLSDEYYCKVSDLNLNMEEEIVMEAGEYYLIFHHGRNDLATVDLEWLPLCNNECSVNAQARCHSDSTRIESCMMDADGCMAWQTQTQCTANEICVAATCLANCFHQCDEGDSTCLNGNQPIECGVDERGCRVWVERETCADNEVCAANGFCVLLSEDAFWVMEDMGDDDMGDDMSEDMGMNSDLGTSWDFSTPDDIILPTRPRGGCEQSTTLDHSHYGVFALLALWCIRRKYWMLSDLS